MWSPVIVLHLLLSACVSANPTKPQYDTIIIGMGAAGTTAASTLCKAGKRVLALEAMNRIGGRVNTVPFGNGLAEMGAEWIHGTVSSRVFNLAKQYNITTVTQGSLYKAYRSDGTAGDTELVNELLHFVLNNYEDPPKKIDSWGEAVNQRVKHYMKTNHPTLDEDVTNEILHYIDISSGSSAPMTLYDESTRSRYAALEGDQEMTWNGNGYKTLFEILLNTYKGGPGYPSLDIQLNKEVTRVSWSRDVSGDVTVSCADGSQYSARNVIVTVSLGVLKERYDTLFSPPLPPKKVEAINSTTIGVAGKIILSFSEVWWNKNMSIYPFIWKGEDRKAVPEEDKWVTYIDGAGKTMGCSNCITFWTAGKYVKKMETLSEEELTSKVMALLRRFMGKDYKIPEPTAMLRSTWYSNPFTRGSYTYDNLSTPLHPTARADLAAPLCDNDGEPRVLFAGEATDDTHFATVHGATDTGFREATRLLQK